MKTRHLSVVLAAAFAALSVACERPPVETEQRGYRGVAMESVENPRLLEAKLEANQAPPPLPPAATGGPTAGEVYQNVQVLGDLSVAEFARVMAAITEWVSPQQGCNYCHTQDMASDDLYTKVVARRMIQMTQHINGSWTQHVKQTGVTCYTCHRGQPLPARLWSTTPVPTQSASLVGGMAEQNAPEVNVGLTSLPYDPFTPFLGGAENIRIQSDTALPDGNRRSIKQAEWTYGLMIHMSEGLGVNCTYCHNSRAFASWEQSSPPRETAWYGIRLARHVNQEYIESLANVFPSNRKGPAGDVLKVNCATCHQGLPKPLNGVSMLEHYPALK